MNQLQQLAKPFPSSLIKPPPQGKHGSYVPHVSVNEKLLAILGVFSFEIVEILRGYAPEIKSKKNNYLARENAIIGVLARLTTTVDGNRVIITEVGSEDNPAMHNDAENAKNATSDALKRCAMRLGCGLHMWHKDSSDYVLDRVLNAKNTIDATVDQNGHTEDIEVVGGFEDVPELDTRRIEDVQPGSAQRLAMLVEKELGVTRKARLEWATKVVEEEVLSFKELEYWQAHMIHYALEQRLASHARQV